MPNQNKLSMILGQLSCWLGFHKFRVIDVSISFGASGNVEKIQCQRCGRVNIRSMRD